MTHAPLTPPTLAQAEHCATLLDQAQRLISQLSPAQFSGVPAGLDQGVGSQLRHCIDFFGCFFAGLPEGRIDYDRRQRSVLCERDPVTAATCLRELARRLRQELRLPAEQPLLVRMDETRDTGFTRSSLARELRFLASHTIHHFAVISILVRLQGETPDPCFGLAPSTLSDRLGETV